jgi:hypothetical protein
MEHAGTWLRLADVQQRMGESAKASGSLNQVSKIEASSKTLLPEGEQALRRLVQIERATLPLNDPARLATVTALADRLRKRADAELVKVVLEKPSEAEAGRMRERVERDRADAEALLMPHLNEPFSDPNSEYGVRNQLAVLAACKEDYKGAVAHLERSLSTNARDFMNRFSMAVFLAAAGDKAAFDAERLLQAGQIAPPGAAMGVAANKRPVARVFHEFQWLWRTVLLTPGMPADEITRISYTLFPSGIESPEEEPYYGNEREDWRALLTGWARFRAGEFADADFYLGEAGKSQSRLIAAQALLLSAMSAHRQGAAAKAQTLHAAAEAIWTQHLQPFEHTDTLLRLHDVLAVRILLAEARTLIQGKGAP